MFGVLMLLFVVLNSWKEVRWYGVVGKILLEPTGKSTVVVNSTYQRLSICLFYLDTFETSNLNSDFRHKIDFRRLKIKGLF